MAWYRWEQSNLTQGLVRAQYDDGAFNAASGPGTRQLSFISGNYSRPWTKGTQPTVIYAVDSPQVVNGTIQVDPQKLVNISTRYDNYTQISTKYALDYTFDRFDNGMLGFEIAGGPAGFNSQEGDEGSYEDPRFYYLHASLPDGCTIYQVTMGQVKGTFIQYVYSTDAGAYPEDGISGEYWYSGRTEVLPTAPGGITVPAAVAGEACAVAWTAAAAGHGSIASYVLERSVNGSGWEQIFSGNALTYTDTIGSDWATVAYRVKAVDDGGGSGPYAASETQVVNAGILYISGPVSDMGEKTAPFAFTVSTGVSGQSGAVSVSLRLSLDGETLYSGTVSTGQDVSVTIDTRTMGEGGHTIAAIAGAAGYVGARASYAFSTPGFSLPTGGLGVQLQDNQGRAVFPQGIASLVAGINGRSVAGNLYDLSKRTRVNPNLLINPAFQIDQRGNGSHTTGYGFDCWIGSGSDATVVKNEAGDIVFTSGAYGGYLYQLLEFPVYGAPLTASALVNGDLLTVTATITASGGNGVLYTDWGYFELSLYMGRIRVALYASPNQSFTLLTSKGSAVKLEQGETQTLAYQDSGGSWQPYETPDYTLELLKCQRYLLVLDVVWATTRGAQTQFLCVDLHYQMRTMPTVSVGSIYKSDGSPAEDVQFSAAQCTDNSLYVAQISAVQPANTCLQLRDVTISAEL